MSKTKVLVFFDVSVDGDPYERMIFELFTDVAPKTSENFRQLCTGEKGGSVKTGKPLHYKGTFFHRIVEGYVAQGGDFLRQNGNYGESIYDGKFPDESPKLRHDGPGLLSMAVADRDGRGSLFSITFKADRHLDRKNVVFGKLVKGHELLKKIENAGDDEGKPTVTVKIINSGELNDDEKKGNKLKTGKDATEEHNHEIKRKGKHKKSSKRRRKRRRYYTSESDTSTDSDMDSSESDTDSDSDTSSLSDTSSSSDDRHKKRKRSKRNRHRRGKRKDRRREKRRKRRDKKSKRKSKRNSISDSVSEVKTGSSSQDADAVGVSDQKHKATGNQSPLVEPENSKVSHKKGDAADFSVMENGEFLKENGGHQSNGNRVGIRSDRAADRHPDVLDDLPNKSRIRSLSPRRSMSKSMSRSPRNARRSPGVSAKHSRRSRSLSKSPPYSRRSKSRTPLRSASPPAMSHSRRSRSRSATVSPPRWRMAPSPARASSRRLPLRSVSRSPVRSSRRSPNRSSGRPSRRSISRSPVRPTHRSVSRSSGRAPQRRSPNPSPVRASRRSGRRSYSGSPISPCHRARSPVSDRRRSSSRSPSVDGSPKHVRRGREFSDRFSYVRRYGSRSPDQSPVRSYRYGGNRDRYSNYRRSPRRYHSPPRGRTSPSSIRYSRSVEVRQSKSRGSASPNHAARSSSGSPPRKAGLVSYDDGSPESDRH